MKSLRWFGLLLILVISAVATKAQTAAPDPGIFLNTDPPCPSGVYCATLTYNGPTITINNFFSSVPPPTPFTLSVADPPGYYDALPPYPVYTCGSNIFMQSAPTGTLYPPPPTFTGCNFWDGTITNDEKLSLYVEGGQVSIAIPSDFSCTGSCSDGVAYLGPTPEPGTALLYLTGILCLVGFGRSRLKAQFRT
jgi:hypothetical protein